MLRAAGWTQQRIGDALGMTQQAVSQAFSQPNKAVEEMVAEILELPIHDLFPDRYTPGGTRMVKTVRFQRIRKRAQGNTKPGAAA
ncbi:MAG: helix-turn-helix domain-containing protein [Sneathiellaceae bacterium]